MENNCYLIYGVEYNPPDYDDEEYEHPVDILHSVHLEDQDPRISKNKFSRKLFLSIDYNGAEYTFGIGSTHAFNSNIFGLYIFWIDEDDYILLTDNLDFLEAAKHAFPILKEILKDIRGFDKILSVREPKLFIVHERS
jgi:hypothetical protein